MTGKNILPRARWLTDMRTDVSFSIIDMTGMGMNVQLRALTQMRVSGVAATATASVRNAIIDAVEEHAR